MRSDIIFALSTPVGRAALHLHRIAGEGVINRLSPFLKRPHSKKDFTLPAKVGFPFTRYLLIVDEQGDVVDDAVVTFYGSPNSYSGDETIEISCHGNPLISARLQSLLRRAGCRDAKPGEFTQRAFSNGKLDLTQAEAIAQLINAETEGAITLARTVSEGTLSKETSILREMIIDVLAYIEAHIDFGSDDVGEFEHALMLPKVEEALSATSHLAASFQSGQKIREGVKVALVGHPNAGKSTLYNALLRADRAIVTDIPGTTRDVLEDRLIIEKRDFVLLDTAGLRDATDTVERIGIGRSRSTAASADIVCVVVDLSLVADSKKLLNEAETQIQYALKDLPLDEKKTLVVLSKKDLLLPRFKDALGTVQCEINRTYGSCAAVKGEDVESLRQELVKLHEDLTHLRKTASNPVLISQRQFDRVIAAVESIKEARSLLQAGDYPEKIASVLNMARQSLEEVIGDVSLDNVLEKIFSSFCIGK